MVGDKIEFYYKLNVKSSKPRDLCEGLRQVYHQGRLEKHLSGVWQDHLHPVQGTILFHRNLHF